MFNTAKGGTRTSLFPQGLINDSLETGFAIALARHDLFERHDDQPMLAAAQQWVCGGSVHLFRRIPRGKEIVRAWRLAET